MSEWTAESEESWRTESRLSWLGPLRGEAKRLGLDATRLLDQLDRQRFACALCLKAFEKRVPHIDLDDENTPRGLLCGWCFRYVKAVAHDPLRCPPPRRARFRQSRVLVYLGFVTPIVE